MAMAVPKHTSPAAAAKQFTMEKAATSLRHFARLNVPGIKPECVIQRQALVILRETQSKVTHQQLLAYLETMQQRTVTGSESYQEFWAVPKANFEPGSSPGTMSAAIQAAIADPLSDDGRCDDLLVDHEVFLVIDQSIPRT